MNVSKFVVLKHKSNRTYLDFCKETRRFNESDIPVLYIRSSLPWDKEDAVLAQRLNGFSFSQYQFKEVLLTEE